MNTATYAFQPGQEVFVLLTENLKNYGPSTFIIKTKIATVELIINSQEVQKNYNIQLPKGGSVYITGEDNIFVDSASAINALESIINPQ